MKRTIIRILLMIVVLAALAACGGAEQSTPTTPATDPVGPATETSAAPDTGAPGGEPQLTNRAWTWVRTEMNDGTVIEPRQPEKFTLTLSDNGQVVGTTDCNGFSGSYTLEDGGLLSFGPFASTMMLCENSQETDFVSRLQEVQSYMFADGQLVLLIKMDSGSIILR